MWMKFEDIAVCNVNRWPEESLRALRDGMTRIPASCNADISAWDTLEDLFSRCCTNSWLSEVSMR